MVNGLHDIPEDILKDLTVLQKLVLARDKAELKEAIAFVEARKKDKQDLIQTFQQYLTNLGRGAGAGGSGGDGIPIPIPGIPNIPIPNIPIPNIPIPNIPIPNMPDFPPAPEPKPSAPEPEPSEPEPEPDEPPMPPEPKPPKGGGFPFPIFNCPILDICTVKGLCPMCPDRKKPQPPEPKPEPPVPEPEPEPPEPQPPMPEPEPPIPEPEPEPPPAPEPPKPEPPEPEPEPPVPNPIPVPEPRPEPVPDMPKVCDCKEKGKCPWNTDVPTLTQLTSTGALKVAKRKKGFFSWLTRKFRK